MKTRIAIPILLLFLVACGASARERTLRVTMTATVAAQEGFIAWEHAHLATLTSSATSLEDGTAKLAAYAKASAPVVTGFEGVYRAIAAAALLKDDSKSLATALSAYEQLRLALSMLTGGKLP